MNQSERQPLVRSSSSTSRTDPIQIATEKTSQFNGEVAQLSKLADQLGTQKDNAKLRRQLRIKREDCANQAKSTMQFLKKMKIDRNDRVKFEKVMGQFNDIFTRCQLITKQSIQKERVSVAISNSPDLGDPSPIAAIVDREDHFHQQQTLQLDFESYNVDHAIIEERNVDMAFLESELKGLNEMFVDIATMVREQGEEITTIEDNTHQAAVQVEKGVGELRKASEYQRSARTKMCVLALIVTIILAAIGAFIGIYFGLLKK